ncbi:unnamed protein product [Adineta steineri]|uniref:Cyclohexanone monooxygenase n=1 Tax=Adineta steineri TaxID=433720 RepID=A0A813RW65_9BILA|nr:unnamed protein product [Adineta steineri]CAF4164967.1 unnamed protein product [Adineta steineri]
MESLTQNKKFHFDAIVIGAGFGGLYSLYKLRNDLGLNVRGFEKGNGVGGTWYWNRYPGALSDSESFVYCYSFDKKLLQDWNFNTRYIRQPEVLTYLNHVADRYNLRKDIEFNTDVTAAYYDELRNIWQIRTDKGEQFTATFLFTALGLLAAANYPNIKGRETFKGECYHTSAWPEHVTFDNKRVAVIGTGSTGVQVITSIAPKVKHLTVFQRTPQYSVPVGQAPLSEEHVSQIKKDYDRTWESVRNSLVAMGFEESTTSAMTVSEEERRDIYEKAWDAGGGFRFGFGTFCDTFTDPLANEAAASFIRSKIAKIVNDPETAKKLTPCDLYARRPLCDNGYYATYNRENVSLVDIKATPIVEITPMGIKTSDGIEHKVDLLIFATGFDAVDGNYKRLDIRGRNGISIKDHWKDGPTSYLGVTTAGFPNMFMVLGPNGPFSNLPPAIELEIDWSIELIRYAKQSALDIIEPTRAAENLWTVTCKEIAAQTLFSSPDSWIFGANIPGKPRTVMFFLGGFNAFRQKLDEEAAGNYRNFVLSSKINKTISIAS